MVIRGVLMSQEVELKFEFEQSSIKQLTNFLHNQHLDEQRHFQLTNEYYDTADNILRHNNISVRIRGIHERGQKEHYELTFKSSENGKSIAGLNLRKELNVTIPNNKLDLSLLPASAFPKSFDIEQLSSQLTTLFITDFQRETWLIRINQSQIEVALDQGIISCNNSHVPIAEIEIELKLGSQLDLLLFAHKLSQFNIHLFSQSKAARGYRLVDGTQLEKITSLNIENQSLASDLTTILNYWQTNEEYALAHNDLSFYQSTLSQLINYLTPLLPESKNEYSTKLNQSYQNWMAQTKLVTDVKSFAYSRINTQFKLYLMVLVL